MAEGLTAQQTETLELRGLSADRQWDFENGFYWFSDVTRIGKMMAHLDIYRRILGLPGDVCEFGVFKAASLIRFATFRRLLETEDSRAIRGFDAFGAFPRTSLTLNEDNAFIDRFESGAGEGLSVDETRALLARKGFTNIDLRAGNVFDTVPAFAAERPEARIALLHLDMDVREPTQFVLDELYDRVVRGGVILFDDYGSVAGATEVADGFAVRHGLALRKESYYHVPVYCIKE